jgi:nucleotide-binding universal stress UspA family protein
MEAKMIQNVKRILAPVDFSDYSMDALRAAVELAGDVGAEVHVVYVVAPYYSILELQSNELARETSMLEQGEEELARIHKDQLGGSNKIKTAVMVGPPVQRLIEYAKEQSIDLIVLGTHGRTGAEYLLIGSVAEKVARLAPCSVLVFRRRAR